MEIFYEGSPYFLNEGVGLYPVGRITQPIELKIKNRTFSQSFSKFCMSISRAKSSDASNFND
jgi:hypothetical protein